MAVNLGPISLVGLGFPVICRAVVLIRLRDRIGFAVGVQEMLRTGGEGIVFERLKVARLRAQRLAESRQLPIVESI